MVILFINLIKKMKNIFIYIYGEAVLEGLLEGKELHDAEVDAGVETDTSLVGSDSAVHLYTETAVDVDLALVVGPGDAEHDDALGLDDALHDLVVQEMGIGLKDGSHAGKDFADGLVELGLTWILGDEVGHERLNILFSKLGHNSFFLR